MCQVLTLLKYLYSLAAVCECLRFRCTPKTHIIPPCECELILLSCPLTVPQTQSILSTDSELNEQECLSKCWMNFHAYKNVLISLRWEPLLYQCVVLACVQPVQVLLVRLTCFHFSHCWISLPWIHSVAWSMNSKCYSETAHRQHLQCTTQCRLP